MLKLKQSAQQAATLSLLVSLVFGSLAPAFSMPVFALEQVSNEKPAQQISTSQTDLSQADLLEKPLEAVPEPIIQPIDIGQINPVEINPEEIIPKEDLLPPDDANRDGEEPEPYIQKDEIKSLTDKLNINTDTNTGAFNYAYPIEIPAGRNNLQPDLALSYNNQDTNNQNLFGYGWSLNIPSIERLNKTGIDNLYTDNYFSSSLGGELAPISLSDNIHGIYGPRVENGDFLKYEYTTSSTWIITDKMGTVYTFGKIQADRQDNPNDNTKIYKWMLSEVRDTNDNFIRYQYYKDAGQIYPEKIFYTGHGEIDGIFEIEFVREERADNLGSFQTGFAVVNNYRFSQILVKIDAQWHKKYYLNYETGDNGNRSLLSGIQEAAPSPDQEVEAAMPETAFDYPNDFESAWTDIENLDLPDFLKLESYNGPAFYNDNGVRFGDVNGDGLVDMLHSHIRMTHWVGNIITKNVYINQGNNTWEIDENYYIPVYFSRVNEIGDGGFVEDGARLSDVNGDGFVDIIEARTEPDNTDVKHVYINKGDGTGWEEDLNYNLPTTFVKRIAIDGRSLYYDARLSDVNGDGLEDILVSYRHYTWYYTDNFVDTKHVYINKGDGTGWEEDLNYVIPVPFMYKNLPVSGAGANGTIDTGVRLSDVNGDALVDIIESRYQRIDYYHPGPNWINYINNVYINKGDGTGWEESDEYVVPDVFIELKEIASYFSNEDRFVRLMDINGDNLDDVVKSRYMDYNNEINIDQGVWINKGDGTGWHSDSDEELPFYFSILDPHHEGSELGEFDNGCQFNDVNGDATVDVVCSRPARGNPMDVHDIYINNHNNKILTNINDSDGSQINLNYQSSAQYTESGEQVSMSSERDVEVLLPETEFDYQATDKSFSVEEDYEFPVYFTECSFGQCADKGVEIVDVNGDGLEDVIRAFGRPTSVRQVYINNGQGWDLDASWDFPLVFINGPSSYDQGVRLADVNGDGLNDIIKGVDLAGEPEYRQVYINNGQGWDLDASWDFPLVFINSGYDQGVRLTDVNADGLVDVIKGFHPNVTPSVDIKEVYINNGQGWDLAETWEFPLVFTGGSGFDQGVRLADVNADGLTDVLHGYGYDHDIYINNGQGWDLDASWELPIVMTEWGVGDVGVRLVDINADALVDIIRSWRDSYGELQSITYINNGGAWVEDEAYDIPVPFVRILGNVSQDFYSRVADLDADGVVDITRDVYYYNSAHPDESIDIKEIYITNAELESLSTIYNNQGLAIDLDYQTSAQSRDIDDELSNPKLPYVIQTVKQINVFDGLATTTIDYQYSGGEQYFDAEHPRDKKFAGFAKVEKTIGDKISKTYYQQANETDIGLGESADTYAKIGKVYRQEVYDSEDLKSASIQKWQEEDLDGGRKFVYSDERSSINFASSTVAFATQSDYDLTNGNLLAENNLGQVDLDINTGEILDTLVGDEKTTTYEYAQNITKHILSAPKEKVISDISDTKSQELYYDDLAFGQVNKVNLTKEDYLVDNVEINREFNDLGLVVAETDPENNVSEIVYDENNLYPSEMTNALGQISLTEYNLLNSQVATSTAANSAMTVNSFDAFGRLVKIQISSPSSTTELLTKQEIVYQDFEFPRFREVKDYFEFNQYKIQREYYDGLDRVIQAKTQMAESESWATQDTAYDVLGRVVRQSLPYISQSIGYSEPDLQQVAKTYIYDALDRVLTETTPVGTSTYEYNGFTTTIYDANNNRKDLIKDAYGNLVQVKEYNGQDIYTTNYEYSLTNKLTKITDALANVRNFVYDDLDNLVSQDMIHRPDVQNIQSITYTYDKNGNVLSQTNLNNQTTTYTYDDLNRVLTESVNGSTKITYTYDQGANNVGKLTYINYNHNGNWQSYNYNLLNQLTDYDVRIHGDNYALNYGYNLNNDFKQIDYPSSKQVNYSFNNIGQVNGVSLNSSLVADNLSYNANGQLVHLERANGLTTDYSYTPDQAYRLTNLNTSNATSTLQNIDYTYDAVGNILNITDDANTDLARSATYEYDDLNRLASTTVSYLNIPNSNYSQNFSYDAIGNILTNSALGAYSYTLANPQQLSSVPNQNFTYDNAGNLLTDSQKTLTWDWRSRMIKSQNTGSQNISNYAYDANNQRLMKQTQEPVEIILGAKGGSGVLGGGGNPPPAQYITIAEEHYVDQYYERNDKTNDTKDHIFLNGQKIATINNNNAPYYIISDHLNSSSILVDDVGNIAEVSDYMPFGAEAYSNTIIDLDNDYNFTGKETDEESSLQYFGARYMDNEVGRFISIEPVILALHDNNKLKSLTGSELQVFLQDPQKLQYYSYSRNNPIILVDLDGNWWKELITGKQSFSDFKVELGQAANQLYNDSGAWKAAMDHPVATGVAVGLAGGAAAAGAAAGLTALSVEYLGGVGTTCIAFCSKVPDAVKLLNGPIDIVSGRLQHVIDEHTVDGAKTVGNSIFNQSENIVNLIKQGTQQLIEKQAFGNNFQRVFDVGRNIGIDRATNQQTGIMTIITDSAGKMITAFPGTP